MFCRSRVGAQGDGDDSSLNVGSVPLPDDDILEMPARYPTLNATSDVFGTLAQLAL